MTGIPMTIGSTTYPTKASARDHIRSILHGAEPGSQLSDRDTADVVDLIRRYHPTASDKIGCGIDHVTVELSGWRSPGFVLHRTDGSSTDVSYRHCFQQRTAWGDFCAACREEIADQIIQYRRENFCGVCEYTGESISIDDAEVDHKPPKTFVRLLRDYLDGEDFATVQLRRGGDNSEGVRLADPGHILGWWFYHRVFSNLRIVSRKANQAEIIADAKTLEDVSA